MRIDRVIWWNWKNGRLIGRWAMWICSLWMSDVRCTAPTCQFVDNVSETVGCRISRSWVHTSRLDLDFVDRWQVWVSTLIHLWRRRHDMCGFYASQFRPASLGSKYLAPQVFEGKPQRFHELLIWQLGSPFWKSSVWVHSTRRRWANPLEIDQIFLTACPAYPVQYKFNPLCSPCRMAFSPDAKLL